MKKTILLTITALIAAFSARADIVPQSKARSVAGEFMESSSLTLVWNGGDVATKSGDEEPAFYVYNVSGGGWVMVSAEDCAVPILAYGRSGEFAADKMPANMRAWIEGMKSEILSARASKVVANENVKARWANPKGKVTRAGSGEKVLTTASWDQTRPYNNLLSTYVKDGDTGVEGLYTGCVATAMSIVMRYHKWPEHGTGTLDGYTTTSEGYTVASYSIEDHVYDWDNMPLTDGYYSSNGWTEDQKREVAQVMADAGVMVQMDYTTGGSGAMTADIIPALTTHMQYSKAATFKAKSNYKTSDWMDMIVDDIDNCGPILYGGYDPDEGGHQFICDGYDTANTMIHINWGWGGYGNDFFAFDLDIPNSYTFSEDQDAIFGLVPDKTGTSVEADPDVDINSYYSITNNTRYGEGIEVTSGTVAKGEDFTLNTGAYTVSSDAKVYFKAVLVDKDGDWKEDISGTGSVSLRAGYIYPNLTFNCSISSDISLGDRIAIWYKVSGDWKPVLTPVSDYSYPWTYACWDANFIAVEDSYSAGDVFTFELIPGNQSISDVTWYFDGAMTAAEYLSLSKGEHTVEAEIDFADGTSEVITQVLNVQ